MNLMGGKVKFTAMLDSVFVLPPIYDESYYGTVIHEIREMQISNMGQYAHGNQPIQHMIYLYNYAGVPWKAQGRLREVMNRMYNPGADGYCGDEDNGQTSAWYVFSALGFYPVCPGTDQYVIGSPLFKQVQISLSDGKKILINAKNNDKHFPYIKSMKMNGNSYSKNWISHKQISKGCKMEFVMSDRPEKARGVNKEDRPYSITLIEEN
jgi:predicted alpha-1,2-mannosidase